MLIKWNMKKILQLRYFNMAQSKPYFIQLYSAVDNSLINKYKFVLPGTSVKEIKHFIIQKLMAKGHVEKQDTISIKDNDQYQLGSDDQVTDVIPDGKVKLYLTKSKQVVNPPPQIPQVPIVLAQQTSSTSSTIIPQSNTSAVSQQIDASTNAIDLSSFIAPKINPEDKIILKVICPQIRKSLIQIPIRQQRFDFLSFSSYVVNELKIGSQLKTILYSQVGQPLLYNLDLMNQQMPKLDYSKTHFIVFTKTLSACDNRPQMQMMPNSNMVHLKIVKNSAFCPIDINFQIDLGSTLSALKYKIFQMTKIHPSNQILKFGNNVLSNELEILSTFNLKENSIVQLTFKLNSNIKPSSLCDKFYYKDVKMVNEQTQQAIQIFRSNLIVLSAHLNDQNDVPKMLYFIQKYTNDLPLVYSLKTYLRDKFLSQASRIALEQGLFVAILNYAKSCQKHTAIKISQLFCHIRGFFGFVLQGMSKLGNLVDIKKYQEFVTIQENCTFTLKQITRPCLVKLDNQKVVLIDKQHMKDQILKGFTYDLLKTPKVEDLYSTSQLQQNFGIFTQNHIDNDTFTSILWTGKANAPTQPVLFPDTLNDINFYISKIDSYPNLEVNLPLQIKNKTVGYLLLKTKQNRLRVYVSRNKDINRPYNLFDPITGNQQAVNLDLMSGAAKTENVQEHIDVAQLKPVITRQPKEAIVVLFDISGSMGWQFFNQPDLKRIGAVKSFFQAFAYRTIAYNLQHVVSLIFFDTQIQVQCDFTQAIYDFNRLISNAQPRGGTRLYDSIVQAAEQLARFQIRYPECKLRILALTDGQDNQSQNTVLDAAKIVVKHKIIMDSFAVGASCDGLKTITLATGGKCYLTRNLQESLKLFEQQTVLSVRVRSEDELKSNLPLQQLIEKAKSSAFHQVKDVHKFSMPTNLVGKSGKDLAKKYQNQQQAKKIAGNSSLKRISKQIQNFTKDPHPFVSIYPNQDLKFWKILLLGPKQTPYQNGLFLLYAKFPNDYPFRAPQIRFITPIYHCNMNQQGRICHSVFDRNYSPALSFKQIIQCVYGLILTPQPEDPLDNVVASFFLSDYPVYAKNAKEATLKNASMPIQKIVQELFGSISDDIQRQKKIKEIEQWVAQAKTHN